MPSCASSPCGAYLGIQHEWELDQWLELSRRDPALTPELEAVIEKDRRELAGSFCRSCGYCLPCSARSTSPRPHG